jgi:hypothetical protein
MSRPGDFTGFISVVSGATGNPLTAIDWNAFTDRIIAFAKYKALGDVIGTFSSAYKDSGLYYDMFNEAVAGLNVLKSYITQPIPAAKYSGQDLYASYIQALKTALNSIT